MKSLKIRILATVVALLVVLAGLWIVLRKNAPAKDKEMVDVNGIKAVQALEAEPVAKDMTAQQFMESEDHWTWWDTYRKKMEVSAAQQKDMAPFYQSIMAQILAGEEENTVCSPVNLYLAFAMLAETADGNTRAQILDMLKVDSIEALRVKAKALWDSNAIDTPILKSLLANSLWLRETSDFNQETLSFLAEQYHASSYYGDPGSEEMTKALQDWTNAHTGDLLTEYTKDLKLEPSTVMALVSTLYYKAGWTDVFYPNNISQGVFHGRNGDVMVDMMHRSDMMGVYNGDHFSAVGLNLNDSGQMYFLLPEEGVDVESLLTDPQLLEATNYDKDEHWSYPMVNLAIPKFKASCKTDLLESLEALGVTDALDPALADFSPLTENVYISQAEHAAMVEVDENGVTGAAYTEIALAEGAAEPEEEIDFIVDRPFLFMVTGRDGSVLFAGIVKNIE